MKNMPEKNQDNGNSSSIFNPHNWGLPIEAVCDLGNRLKYFWERFRDCFKTKTRDTSDYGYTYLSGQMRMETNRNFANIGRRNGVAGQNMQHFMTNSPWSSSEVIKQVQNEIKETPELQKGGVVSLDESADEKSGEGSAGAGRQYNGRMGKVDMSQVGTFLSYSNLTCKAPVWTWVDAELFIPEKWFDVDMKEKREKLKIPKDREFKTKIELGWEMIKRTKENGLLFEFVSCDAFYGRDNKFRSQMREDNILYMADIPKDTPVYLNKPALGIPEAVPGKRGPKPKKAKVLSEEKPVRVDSLTSHLDWKIVDVRSVERGMLSNAFAARRVWTVWDDKPVEEWLVIRRESDKKHSYSLSNESPDTSIEKLAWQKCQRYFVERANQDAKSEAGWDEFQAQKYTAWEHHTAFCVLSCWFMAQTKLNWALEYDRDEELYRQLEAEILPFLSFSNIRELLRAVMPLPQLTPEEAVLLVIQHLINRTRSRKSRLKNGKIRQ